MSIAVLSVEGKFYWKCDLCNQKSASLYEHKSVAKAKSASHAMTNKHLIAVSNRESASNERVENQIIGSVSVNSAILDNNDLLDRGNAFKKHDLKQGINRYLKNGDSLQMYDRFLTFCISELNIKIDFTYPQAIVLLDDVENVEENSDQYKLNYAIAIIMKEIENHDVFDYREFHCYEPRCRFCLVNSDIERDELLKEYNIKPHNRPIRWKDEKKLSNFRCFIRQLHNINRDIKELCMLSFQDTDLNKCVFDFSSNKIEKITHISTRYECMNKTKYWNPVIITDNISEDSSSDEDYQDETYEKGQDNWTSMIKQATSD